MTTDTSEKAFQNDIMAHLVSTGYHKRGNHNYNRASCIDPENRITKREKKGRY